MPSTPRPCQDGDASTSPASGAEAVTARSNRDSSISLEDNTARQEWIHNPDKSPLLPLVPHELDHVPDTDSLLPAVPNPVTPLEAYLRHQDKHQDRLMRLCVAPLVEPPSDRSSVASSWELVESDRDDFYIVPDVHSLPTEGLSSALEQLGDCPRSRVTDDLEVGSASDDSWAESWNELGVTDIMGRGSRANGYRRHSGSLRVNRAQRTRLRRSAKGDHGKKDAKDQGHRQV